MTKGTLHQEVVRRLLLTGAQRRIERVIDKMHPADIAELIGGLSPGEFRSLLNVLVTTGRAGRPPRAARRWARQPDNHPPPVR